MKKIILAAAFVLMAGCVSVHRQTVSTVSVPGSLCSVGKVNGKNAVVCPVCAFCPPGAKNCFVPPPKDSLGMQVGLYEKCKFDKTFWVEPKK
jgi:hypothetical protein